MKKISDVSKRAGLVFIIFAVIISMFAVNVQAAEKVFPSGLKSDEIEKAVENTAKDKNCVSAAVAVFSGDDIYTKYYGNADAENDIVTDEATGIKYKVLDCNYYRILPHIEVKMQSGTVK